MILPADTMSPDTVFADSRRSTALIRDSNSLVENGFLVSKENMLYKDSDVAYDAEFDEVEWEGNYTSLKKLLSSKETTEDRKEDVITIELSIEDKAVKEWLSQNASKLRDVVNKLVIDLYHTDQILHSK